MITQELFQQIASADRQIREQTAYIIGTLDEVDALTLFAKQYKQETDDAVRKALVWAGKRLQTAKEAGYSTLEALIQHFHIDAEYSSPQDDPETQEKLRKVQFELERQALKQQEEAAKGQAIKRIGMGTLFGLPGLMMTPPPTMLETDQIRVSAAQHSAIPRHRNMPTRPSDSDITMLVRRLAEEAQWEKRARAATDLAVLVNNPAALPALTRAFRQDRSPQVQEAAQRAAKIIYWNAVYWAMEQDGSMAAEIARRAAEAGRPAPVSGASSESTKEDISAILRSAEAARRKRQKR